MDVVMSMLHRLPDYVVSVDPWTLHCPECCQKMRLAKVVPAQEGREVRTYDCACGHSESFDVALH